MENSFLPAPEITITTPDTDILLDPVIAIRPAFDEEMHGLIRMGVGDESSKPIRLRTGDSGKLKFTLPDGTVMTVKIEVWKEYKTHA